MFTALILTLSQRLLSLKDSVESIIQGFKTMLPAIMILTLAWSVALITEHMHTDDFISGLLMDASVSPYLIPVITFIVAAKIAHKIKAAKNGAKVSLTTSRDINCESFMKVGSVFYGL